MQTETIPTYKIKGVRVDGDIGLLKRCKQFIMVNWQGRAHRVVKASVILNGELHLSWYDPCDKSGMSLFGVDKDGRVICGMAHFANESDGPVILLSPTEDVDPWNY